MSGKSKALVISCVALPLVFFFWLISWVFFSFVYPDFKYSKDPKTHFLDKLDYPPTPPYPETKALIPENLGGVYIGISIENLYKYSVIQNYGYAGPPSDSIPGNFPGDKAIQGYIKLPESKECDFSDFRMKFSYEESLSVLESESEKNSSNNDAKCIAKMIDFVNERSGVKPFKGLWLLGDFEYKMIQEPFYKPNSFKRTAFKGDYCPALVWKKDNVYIMIRMRYSSDINRVVQWGWGIYDKAAFEINYGDLLISYTYYEGISWSYDRGEIDYYFNIPEIKQLTAASGASGYYLPGS